MNIDGGLTSISDNDTEKHDAVRFPTFMGSLNGTFDGAIYYVDHKRGIHDHCSHIFPTRASKRFAN